MPLKSHFVVLKFFFVIKPYFLCYFLFVFFVKFDPNFNFLPLESCSSLAFAGFSSFLISFLHTFSVSFTNLSYSSCCSVEIVQAAQTLLILSLCFPWDFRLQLQTWNFQTIYPSIHLSICFSRSSLTTQTFTWIILAN